MPLLLERAVLEQEEGNIDEARKLFQMGCDINAPEHKPMLEAWIAFERSQHNFERAEELNSGYESLLAREALYDR